MQLVLARLVCDVLDLVLALGKPLALKVLRRQRRRRILVLALLLFLGSFLFFFGFFSGS